MHQELMEQGWSCPSALSSSRRGLLQEWALQRAFSLRFVSFIAFYWPCCAGKSSQRCKGVGCALWQSSGMLDCCRTSQELIPVHPKG